MFIQDFTELFKNTPTIFRSSLRELIMLKCINCDMLIDVNLNSLISLHKKEKNMITVVSSLKRIHIPYGVIETDSNGQILKMSEKPAIEQFINTGMYIVNKKVFEHFPEREFFHMTDVIDELMKDGQKVGIFAISDTAFMG